MTESAIQAVALFPALFSILWRRTWFAARDSAVTRATDTLSSTRMTAIIIVIEEKNEFMLLKYYYTFEMYFQSNRWLLHKGFPL